MTQEEMERPWRIGYNILNEQLTWIKRDKSRRMINRLRKSSYGTTRWDVRSMEYKEGDCSPGSGLLPWLENQPSTEYNEALKKKLKEQRDGTK